MSWTSSNEGSRNEGGGRALVVRRTLPILELAMANFYVLLAM